MSAQAVFALLTLAAAVGLCGASWFMLNHAEDLLDEAAASLANAGDMLDEAKRLLSDGEVSA